MHLRPLHVSRLALLLTAALPGCRKASDGPAAAAYAGRAACADCHAAEDSAWRGSRHDLAMQPADS
ncbi:MAG: hypothetical protein OEW06_14170, partial [Gemmatimonadota bacterium]|nr:hypothetical protein [Gemmatimonadota bacterium]